mmetsp:Transcript_36658/g.78004  ORF Transcript_36658/g.78004 Transcript_36658/m.78004 type:complete len:180 (-) Transcript_36658:79-618(-)
MAAVTVQLDPQSPDLTISLELPAAGACVRWVKEELCKQDPTGKAKPGDFKLATTERPRYELDSKKLVTASLGKLLVMPQKNKSTPEPTVKKEAQGPGEAKVEVDIYHVIEGTSLTISVSPNSTILQVRQEILQAINEKNLSDVKVVQVINDEELEPMPDDALLDGRTELQMLGYNLPNI